MSLDITRMTNSCKEWHSRARMPHVGVPVWAPAMSAVRWQKHPEHFCYSKSSALPNLWWIGSREPTQLGKKKYIWNHKSYLGALNIFLIRLLGVRLDLYLFILRWRKQRNYPVNYLVFPELFVLLTFISTHLFWLVLAVWGRISNEKSNPICIRDPICYNFCFYLKQTQHRFVHRLRTTKGRNLSWDFFLIKS